MSGSRREVRVTDEQFRLLWEAYPDDPVLIAEMCREALFGIHVPNETGRLQSGVRVYRDDGFMGSGYILVHWDDAKNLDWCLDNGYTPHGFPAEEQPIVWDENPDRERAQDIKQTLWEWAYG